MGAGAEGGGLDGTDIAAGKIDIKTALAWGQVADDETGIGSKFDSAVGVPSDEIPLYHGRASETVDSVVSVVGGNAVENSAPEMDQKTISAVIP